MAGTSLGLAACSGQQPATPDQRPRQARRAREAGRRRQANRGCEAGGRRQTGRSRARREGPRRSEASRCRPRRAARSSSPASARSRRTPTRIPTAPPTATAGSQVARLIFGGGLLDQDANTLEYIPYAASEWSVSQDGKTFTFKLRDGMKWSDGKPIIVDDYTLRLFRSGQGGERLRRPRRPRAHRVVHGAGPEDAGRRPEGDAGEGRRDRRGERRRAGPEARLAGQVLDRSGREPGDPASRPSSPALTSSRS